jgi:ribosomal protein S18 acetylase RimI-like enzyme
VINAVDAAAWDDLALGARVIAPADARSAHALVGAALRAADPAVVSAAVVGSTVVGLALMGPPDPRDGGRELLALGVSPAYRRRGLATALLRANARPGTHAFVTLAERDPVDPLARDVRASIARRLLEDAGFIVRPADEPVASIDPLAVTARVP